MAADIGGRIAPLWSWGALVDFVLENGMRVLFTPRKKSPVVEVRVAVDGGFALDPNGRSGLAGFATAMINEGLVCADGVRLDSALAEIGALPCGQVMPDGAIMGVSALSGNLGDTLRIYADALTRPKFAPQDLEAVRAARLALIADERLNPFELGLRFLPFIVYGRDHHYARPFTGSGTEKDVATVTFDDLHNYYETRVAPHRITLVVAGAAETVEVRARLEETFGKLSATPAGAISTSVMRAAQDAPSVIIVNRCGSPQTTVAAGLCTVARGSSHAEALVVADAMMGGMFASRLNLSLRESKGWTYGVRSSLHDTRLQGWWLIRTAVRSDSTAQAMAEIAAELEALAGHRPPTPDEFSRAVNYLVARIPSCYETCAQMADALAGVIIQGLPPTYPWDLASRLLRLTPKDVAETCRYILSQATPRWLVVGDADQFLDRVSAAIPGKILVVEPDSSQLP
jgi:zinc protease